MLSLSGVPAALIEGLWEKIEPLIQESLEESKLYLDYSTTDIYFFLCSSEMQCWIVEDQGDLVAVLITQILVFPQRKVLEVFAAAGTRMEEWLYMVSDTIWAFAKERHCKGMRVYGRPGWARLFQNRYGEIYRRSVIGVEL